MRPGSLSITIQYLEGSAAHARRVCPPEVLERLQAIQRRVPLQRLLLGWNLPEAVIETCAAECQRQGIELYLWHPLLTGDGSFSPRQDWSTIGLTGKPVPGHGGLAEFTFICPNHPEARAAALDHLEAVLAAGYYQGVFLDRMRFPSPAGNPEGDLACFCPDCQRAAEREGIDLPQIQLSLREGLTQPQERACLAAGLLTSPRGKNQPHDSLGKLLAFRQASITGMVQAAAETARRQGLKVGLDCFSPSMAAMVGQDLSALSHLADWIKVMTYIRAYGPATIPFELLGLAGWLRAGGMSEAEVLSNLAASVGWSLPGTLSVARNGGLAASILATEVARARRMVRSKQASGCELLAGIELVELEGVAALKENQIRYDLAVLADSCADGLVLSWDGWLISLERLELVGEGLQG
jgi:hypothetical protein